MDYTSIVLVAAILGAIGTLGYVIATPEVGERFTQFHILGLEGEAEGYPKELGVGEEARVIVGIVNQEHEDMSYRVEVTIDGTINEQIGPVVLAHQEKWRGKSALHWIRQEKIRRWSSSCISMEKPSPITGSTCGLMLRSQNKRLNHWQNRVYSPSCASLSK